MYEFKVGDCVRVKANFGKLRGYCPSTSVELTSKQVCGVVSRFTKHDSFVFVKSSEAEHWIPLEALELVESFSVKVPLRFFQTSVTTHHEFAGESWGTCKLSEKKLQWFDGSEWVDVPTHVEQI